MQPLSSVYGNIAKTLSEVADETTRGLPARSEAGESKTNHPTPLKELISGHRDPPVPAHLYWGRLKKKLTLSRSNDLKEMKNRTPTHQPKA